MASNESAKRIRLSEVDSAYRELRSAVEFAISELELCYISTDEAIRHLNTPNLVQDNQRRERNAKISESQTRMLASIKDMSQRLSSTLQESNQTRDSIMTLRMSGLTSTAPNVENAFRPPPLRRSSPGASSGARESRDPRDSRDTR